MHYVVQSLANEVPALFLPSAIFGHIRSEGALLLCVVSTALASIDIGGAA